MTTDFDLLADYTKTLNAEAFAQLVERYQRLVFSTCRRRLHAAGDVDDAVQETFLRLAKTATARRDNLGAWIYRCAVNVATDHNRRRSTRDRHESAAARPEITTNADRELAELREHLDAAMARLDDAQRELIVQRFFAGRSQADLAAAAGVTPSAISHRLDRAVDALRQHLSKLGCVAAATAIVTLLDAEHASAAVPTALTAKIVAIGLSGVRPTPPRLRVTLAATALVGGISLMVVGLWMATRPTPPPPVAALPPSRGVNFTVTSGGGGVRETTAPPVWKAGAVASDAPLSGRVVDTAGKPIPNATVMSMGKLGTEVKTDADGRYVVPKLETGQYLVGVQVDGFLPARWNSEGAPSLVVSADSHAQRDFVLTRGVVVIVSVFNADHEPLSNADINVVLGTGVDATFGDVRTGSAGTAVVTLPVSAAPARVMVDAEDHIPAMATVTPESVDHPQSVDVTLYDGHAVHGVALCADGKPAKGWKIYPQPTWWQKNRGLPYSFYAEIDGNGRFTLNHVDEGLCGLQLTKPDTNEIFDLGVFTFPAANGEELHVTVPGPSPGSRPSLSGRLTFSGAGGLPAYLDISVISHGAEHVARQEFIQVGQNVDHTSEEIQTQGLAFEIKDLPASEYTLKFSATDMDARVIEHVRIPGPPVNVDLNINGKPRLAGTVLDPAGRPVTHFAVRVKQIEHLGQGDYYVQEEKWVQVADDHGHFNVELVSPGVYRAQVSADGYAWAWTTDGRVEHAGDTAEAHVQLSAGGSLRGSVIDPTGKPVPNAKVTPLSKAQDIADRVPSFASDAGSVVTDSAGRFTVDHLVAGSETLQIKTAAFAPAIVAGLDVIDGHTTDVRPVQLQLGGNAEGTVCDRKGEPLADVAVEFQDDEQYHPFTQVHAAHMLARAITDVDGHYAVAHLPPQDVTVVIADEHRNDVCVQQRTLHPVEGRTARLDFGGTSLLTGRLIARGNKPIGNANLRLAFGDANGPFCAGSKTDADGRFVFRGVPAGNLSLSRDSDAGFNHTRILGDVATTGREQSLGDLVDDVGGVLLHVSSDDPETMHGIAEIEIERQRSHGWWDQSICSAGQDDASTPSWRAVDVPAGELKAVVTSKPAWAVIATVPFVRVAGADVTTVNVHLSRVPATKPAEPVPDGRVTIWLRRWSADGVLEMRGPAVVTVGGQAVPVDAQIDGGWSYRVLPGPCVIDIGGGRTRTVIVPGTVVRNAVEPVDVFEDR